jgi:hypothetical protein
MLGWVPMGTFTLRNHTQQNQVLPENFHITMGPHLRIDLQKFWELEELLNN